jgi:hypothetical protein
MSLITLKNARRIAHYASKLGYSSAKHAIEAVLLIRVGDLEDMPDIKAEEIITELERQYRINGNQKANDIIAERRIHNENIGKPTNTVVKSTKSKKKEMIVIE